jgi:hypothetical protein
MPNCVQNVTFIQSDLVRPTVHAISSSNLTQTLPASVETRTSDIGDSTVLYRTGDNGINSIEKKTSGIILQFVLIYQSIQLASWKTHVRT